MNGIVTCIGYDDYLSLTLPRNRHHFGRVLVLTAWSDSHSSLMGACFGQSLGTELHRTDAFTRHGASFNKGLALEEGFDVLGRNGWICHLDADIVLPLELDLSGIGPGHLYVARRRLCLDPRDYTGQTDWSHWPLIPEKAPFDCGAFQLFHGDDPVLATRPWYPVDWVHAGGSDTEFNAKWPADKRHYLPFEVLHLGEPYRNWHGRQTPRLDGTVPEGAAQAREAMAAMYAARGKQGYEGEKLSPRR